MSTSRLVCGMGARRSSWNLELYQSCARDQDERPRLILALVFMVDCRGARCRAVVSVSRVCTHVLVACCLELSPCRSRHRLSEASYPRASSVCNGFHDSVPRTCEQMYALCLSSCRPCWRGCAS